MLLLKAATNCAQLLSYSPLAVSALMNYPSTLWCTLIQTFRKSGQFATTNDISNMTMKVMKLCCAFLLPIGPCPSKMTRGEPSDAQ